MIERETNKLYVATACMFNYKIDIWLTPGFTEPKSCFT